MSNDPTIKIDARGLTCPQPMMMLSKAYKGAKAGDIIEIVATDLGFKKDVEVWARRTKNELLKLEQSGDELKALIKVTKK